MRFGGERSHFCCGIGRITELDFASQLGQPLDDLLNDVFLDEEPGAGYAGLTAGIEDPGHCAFDCQIQICVIEDYIWGFAAELKNDFLGSLGGD
jgi:hypothetical protein